MHASRHLQRLAAALGLVVMTLSGAVTAQASTPRGPGADRPAPQATTPTPYIQANLGAGPNTNVEGYNWTPFATVHIGVDYAPVSETPVYDFTGQTTADSFGAVNFVVNTTPQQMTPYTHIHMYEDAGAVRDLYVDKLAVEKVDATSNIVSGWVPYAASKYVYVSPPGVGAIGSPVSSDGTWAVNVDGWYDINVGEWMTAYTQDAQGNRTTNSWNTNVPWIRIDTSQQQQPQLQAMDFAKWTQVTVQVDPTGGNTFTESYGPIEAQPFSTNFFLSAMPPAGAHVRMTGGGWTKDLIVAPLVMDYANPDNNLVQGTLIGAAYASTPVLVEVNPGNGTSDASGSVFPSGLGNWNFNTGPYDLKMNDFVTATVKDADGDATVNSMNAAVAYVIASLEDGPPSQIVVGFFPQFQNVQVQVDYGGDGTYEYDQTQQMPSYQNGAAMAFDLGGTGLLHPGDKVHVVSGHWVKDLTLTTLRVEKVDPTTDTVEGYSDNGSLGVDVFTNNSDWNLNRTLHATPDVNGHWSVNFSGEYDIQPGEWVTASNPDADRDETHNGWSATTPWVGAGPTWSDQDVNLGDWSPGTPVTVTVDTTNDGTVDETRNVTAEQYGFVVNFGVSGLIQVGSKVTATGGGWTKVLIVGPLEVTNVDVATQTVTGTATAGAEVHVTVYQSGGGWPPAGEATVTAGQAGQWSATFASGTLTQNQPIDAYVLDGDMDRTLGGGYLPPPQPALEAASATNLNDGQQIDLSGANWPADSTVYVFECETSGGFNGNCDHSTAQAFTADSGGSISGQFTVHRTIDTTNSGAVDCGTADGTCGLAAAAFESTPFESPMIAGFDPSGLPLAFAPLQQIVFGGFLKPVAMTGFNDVKAGATVRLQWKLTDQNGKLLTDSSLVTAVMAQEVDCENPYAGGTTPVEVTGRTGITMRRDGTFSFNWVVPKTGGGTCRLVYVHFSDGTDSARALFRISPAGRVR